MSKFKIEHDVLSQAVQKHLSLAFDKIGDAARSGKFKGDLLEGVQALYAAVHMLLPYVDQIAYDAAMEKHLKGDK